MVRLTIETPSGHKGLLTTAPTAEGWVVRMAAYWRAVLTPAVALMHFHGDDAEERADRYARRLELALLDEPEVVE